jgi:uncharacterized protein YndB with AHSA1/START domain
LTEPLLTQLDRPSDREVRFTRVIDAPRERVWQAWTDPIRLAQWWGPAGFTTTTKSFDLRVGGEWLLTMHGPDGTDYPNRIVFREIVPPSLLVYENGWDLPGAPLDFKAVITFKAEGTQTHLTLHMAFYDAEAFRVAVERYGAIQGGIEHMARLAAYLAKEGA